MGRLDGVSSCEVSLMAKSMKVDFDESVVSEEKIFSVVKELGYGIYNEGEQPEGKAQNRDNKLFIRFIISVCLLAPLLYVSMGHMIKAPVPFFLNPHKGYGQWFALYQCILAAAVIAVNFSFFKNGIVAVFKRVPNMDTLVALGSGASFIYSLVLTVLIFVGNSNGNPSWSGLYSDLHFESAATILALVTVGKWLEEKSKKKTGTEIEKLLKLAPDTVTVECDGVRKTVPVKEVKVGNIVVVKQGEYVPVDGIITDGHGFVDKCAVTGESLPVEVTSGDAVTSAAIVTNGVLKLRAERVGDQTTLSKIIEMVREAGASKAPIQKLADKIAGIFVPVVTAIALITFLVWLLIDGGFKAEHCVTYAISVLVVSCPCALGLATPVAIMTATGKAASLGLLYKDAESLQRVCGINSVLLDKTATLTLGKPQVTDVCVFGCDREEILKIACGIERNSNHPLAKCVVEYVGDGAEVSDFSYIVGQGARAVYGGEIYSLGNIKLVTGVKISKEVKDSAANLSAQGKTVLYMADSKRVVALIAVADVIKEGSGQAISMLKDRNMKIAMLTGDESKTAQAVAASVGIDDFVAEVMPEDKLNAVVNLQNAGGCVAMVGDGINDSPALKQADVGIAMGSGTDVAIDSADVILVGEDLRTLDTVFDLSRATVRNIKENLFWAFIYNVIGIPLAAGVWIPLFGWQLNPMFGAAAMGLSSFCVVSNALRLNWLDVHSRKNSKYITEKEKKIMKKTLKIEGMMCGHCEARVKKCLEQLDGVESAAVSHENGTAEVTLTKDVSNDVLRKAVEEQDYQVTGID